MKIMTTLPLLLFQLLVFLLLSELQGEGIKGLSKETVIGISLGSFVFGLLLCVIPFYCIRKARRRSKSRSKQDNTFALREKPAYDNPVYS